MIEHITPLDQSFPTKRAKVDDPSEVLQKTYEKMQDSYIKDGLTQQILVYLKTLLKNKELLFELKSFPLLRMLEDTCKEFFLNELEATMWSIFLEKLVWENKSKPIQILLLYTAFAVKSYMNSEEDINVITSYISQKYGGFFTGYEKWHSQYSEQLFISQRNFNQYYNNFIKLSSLDLTDYNYYVDDLLQNAPSSTILENESKPNFLVENEEVKAPELMTLNSVFYGEEGLPELKFGRTLSIDANRDIDNDMLELYMAECLASNSPNILSLV